MEAHSRRAGASDAQATTTAPASGRGRKFIPKNRTMQTITTSPPTGGERGKRKNIRKRKKMRYRYIPGEGQGGTASLKKAERKTTGLCRGTGGDIQQTTPGDERRGAAGKDVLPSMPRAMTSLGDTPNIFQAVRLLSMSPGVTHLCFFKRALLYYLIQAGERSLKTGGNSSLDSSPVLPIHKRMPSK